MSEKRTLTDEDGDAIRLILDAKIGRLMTPDLQAEIEGEVFGVVGGAPVVRFSADGAVSVQVHNMTVTLDVGQRITVAA